MSNKIIVYSFFTKESAIANGACVTKECPSIYECNGNTPLQLEVTEDELYYMGMEDDIKLYSIIDK